MHPMQNDNMWLEFFSRFINSARMSEISAHPLCNYTLFDSSKQTAVFCTRQNVLFNIVNCATECYDEYLLYYV